MGKRRGKGGSSARRRPAQRHPTHLLDRRLRPHSERAPEGGHRRPHCGPLAVERCPFRSRSDPLLRVFARSVTTARLSVMLWRRSRLGQSALPGHTESGTTSTSRGRRGGQPGSNGEAASTWQKAMAPWAGATLPPGEALSRRLKLVAAPARSQSEPDSGRHRGGDEDGSASALRSLRSLRWRLGAH